MKKVLIFTADEGHFSLAQALAGILENKFSISIVNLFSKKARILYTPFYRYFPFLFKIPYKIGEQKQVQKGVKILVEKWLLKKTKKAIKKNRPGLIISTHLFYNPAIAKFLDYQNQSLPFFNLIANPWTIHPLEFSSVANLNLVYDQKSLKIGRQNKISSQKLLAIGWPTRKNFYKKYNLTKIRKQLGFKKDVFTLLICGGSEGNNMILKILPALFIINKPLQIIVACGSNKTLYKAISSLQKLLPRLAKINSLKKLNNVNLKTMAFTNKLSQLMNISNLVAGKAGPNLLFEAVAQEKPFLAICHISGQEDANLEIIKKKKLGFVEENPFKAIKLLKRIIRNPSLLSRFTKNIQQEKINNQKNNAILIKAVSSFLTNKK